MEFLQRFKMTNANKRPWIESDTIQLLEHKRDFADVNVQDSRYQVGGC